MTVGPAGSGAQFTQIQAAIDAAQEDDVILVQSGTYQRITVGKPVRVLAVAPGVVIVGSVVDQPAVLVSGIAAGKEFVLSGISASATRFLARPSTIRLENSPGTLALHDVLVRYAPEDGSIAGVEIANCARALLLDSQIDAGYVELQTAAVVTRASELWIANSEIRGADDLFFALSGSHGVDVTDSTLRVWRSLIVGGGGDGKPGIGSGNGGAAVRATRSTVQLFGGPTSQLRGGDGGATIFGSGLGGPGVALLQGSTARIQKDIPIQGGANGIDPRSPAIQADASSSFTLDPKTFPTLLSSAQRVRVGASFGLTLTGNPGGYEVLFLSVRTGPTSVQRGVDGFGLLDRANLFQMATEVLPASGAHTTTFRVPNTASLLGTTLFFQTAERFPNTPPPGFAIGNPVLVTITG